MAGNKFEGPRNRVQRWNSCRSFFSLSPPSPSLGFVSMRLSEINRKSIVEVSLMNGLYITNVRTLRLEEVCWIDGESLPTVLFGQVSRQAKQFSIVACNNKFFLSFPDSFHWWNFPRINIHSLLREIFNTLNKLNLRDIDSFFSHPFIYL